MQLNRTVRILVVDYQTVVRSGIAAILGEYPDFKVIGAVESGDEAIRFCERDCPDIVSFDLDEPGVMNGVDIIRVLNKKHSQARIVVLTNLFEPSIVREALQAGAICYLLKNIPAEDLAHAIRYAYHGKPTLSPEVTQMLIEGLDSMIHLGFKLTHREHQVLELLTQGKNNTEIAKELQIGLSTTQFHVSNILAKLNVHNRIEAATLAVRQKLV